MSLASDLKRLADAGRYADLGKVDVRWGQILRQEPSLGDFITGARESGLLVPLRDLAAVKSGVVPRANAFFLVRELRFEEVPERFNLTRRDYEKVAVVEDGLKTRHRVERICLRETLKGPESLRGPRRTTDTDERLFDCQDRSKDELRELRANGALSYLRRGETVDYRVSEDSLKRGVPADRAQVKNRKPYWYSLHSPEKGALRIAVPEHFDKRFVATLIPETQDAVVIDTLYSVEPRDGVDADLLLASLNSLLTFYQVELRGRTQHGEGVLKVKIADWGGVLVLNPQKLAAADREALLEAFKPVADRDALPVVDEVVDADRIAFDAEYLRLAGAQDPVAQRLDVEREMRACLSERHERAHSVDDAKAQKTKTIKTTASVDAYATRIAATLEPHPDPRRYVPDGAESALILVSTPWEGALRIGEDLFTEGQVLAGDQPLAQGPDIESAQFIRAVLLHDPQLTSISVPKVPALDEVMRRWEAEISAWRTTFEEAVKKGSSTVNDDRTRQQIRDRVLTLLHAQ